MFREQLLDGIPKELSFEILQSTSLYLEKNLGRLGGFCAQLSAPPEQRRQLATGPGTDPIARIGGTSRLLLAAMGRQS